MLAEGVKEEFKMALDKGIFVVPVGCTGSMAAELYKEVINNFVTYCQLSRKLVHFFHEF